MTDHFFLLQSSDRKVEQAGLEGAQRFEQARCKVVVAAYVNNGNLVLQAAELLPQPLALGLGTRMFGLGKHKRARKSRSQAIYHDTFAMATYSQHDGSVTLAASHPAAHTSSVRVSLPFSASSSASLAPFLHVVAKTA